MPNLEAIDPLVTFDNLWSDLPLYRTTPLHPLMRHVEALFYFTGAELMGSTQYKHFTLVQTGTYHFRLFNWGTWGTSFGSPVVSSTRSW